MTEQPTHEPPSDWPAISSHSPLLNQTVDELCADYLTADNPLNHLRACSLPNHRAVIAVLEDIKDVLFPDHRLDRPIRQSQMRWVVGGLVEKVHHELRRQVHLAQVYSWEGDAPCPHRSEHADALTVQFIACLPAVRGMLASDVLAAMKGDPAAKSYDEIVLSYPGFDAIATYRIAHELYRLGVPLLPRIMAEHAHSLTGCDIHPGATIGKSFFIDHATGVVIGETTIIGEGVKLYQGVTLGGLKPHKGQSIRGTKRHPTIEDNVVIFAGATVLGGETVIGEGSKIGGSCWIVESVPRGTTVMLDKPRMTVRTPEQNAGMNTTQMLMPEEFRNAAKDI